MVVAAALLVLTGLGLFVGGIVTGTTVFYWLCVVACAAAGIFLLLARARMGRTPPPPWAQERAETAGTHRTSSPAGAPAGDAVAPASAPVSSASLPEAPAAPAAAPAHAPRSTTGASTGSREPPVEDVEVTDLLLVVDLRDEVLVVDEHPRYHLGGCRSLARREPIPLPLDEARTDGFTPCGWCRPDRTLAERERGRRAGRGA